MPTPTYDLLASSVLSSTATAITFSSITQDFRDLVLVVQALGSGGVVGVHLRLNSDSGANYPLVDMVGNGSTASSSGGLTTLISGATANTTNRSLSIYQIMDYSATDKHKTVLVRNNRADDRTAAVAARWRDTSAVTTVLVTTGGTYAAGSTFHLYGIVA